LRGVNEQVLTQRRGRSLKDRDQEHAAKHHVENCAVSPDYYFVDDDLRENRGSEAEELQRQRGNQDFSEQSVMRPQQRKEASKRSSRFFDSFQFARRRETEQVSRPAFDKLLSRKRSQPRRGICNDDPVGAHFVEHHVVEVLPMDNGRHFELLEVLVIGSQAARPEAEGLCSFSETVKRSAVTASGYDAPHPLALDLLL